MAQKEREWERESESESEIRADYAQVIPVLESGDYTAAISISLLAQKRSHDSGHTLLEAETTTQIGRAYRGLGDLDRAEYYGYKAAIIAYPVAPRGENTALPVPLTFLGGILEERGNLAKARIVYQEAIDNKLPSSQDPAYKNETRIRLYALEYQLGPRSKESMIEESEKAIEDSKNGLVTVKDSYARAVWISGSYHRMINLLLKEDLNQAESLLRKSRDAINTYQWSHEFKETLDLTQRQEDWWKIAEKLPINLEDLYTEAQKKRDAHSIAPARIDYEHIRSLAEGNEDIELFLHADQMLGILLHMEGKYQEAINHLSIVLKKAEVAEDIATQGDIERDIGWAYYNLNDLLAAEVHLQRSVDLLYPTGKIQKYGISYLRLLIVRNNIGSLSLDVLPMLEATLEQMEAARGIDNSTYYEFNGTKLLCKVLVDRADYTRAQEVYNKAMLMKQQIEKPEDKRFVDDTRELEELYRRIEERN